MNKFFIEILNNFNFPKISNFGKVEKTILAPLSIFTINKPMRFLKPHRFTPLYTPLSILCLFFMSIETKAQNPILPLEESISRALKQNLGIKVSENDIEIAKNNAVRGNAGFLPTVNAVGGLTPSFGYLNQKLSNGNKVDRSNLSNNLTGGVQLNWLLYDGKRMFLELDRLKELQGLGEINLRIRAEQIVYDVMRTYYSIVRNQELYKSLDEQLNLFEERLRIAQTRLEVGKGNQLDVLQAQTDLNVQKTNLLRQKQAIEVAKLQLNQLMSGIPNTVFDVKDSMTVRSNWDFNELKNNAVNKNLNVDFLTKQMGIAMLVEKQIETFKKPRLTLNSAFTLGRQDNTAGLFLVNQNTGLNAGVSVIYPLYDGGNIKRQQANSKIEIASNKLRIDQLKTDLTNNLNIAYQNYLNALEILKAEEENAKVARQSIAIAMERYRLSRSTVLELAQIQQALENTIFRSVAAKFEAKMAEIDLMRLSGMLTR
jgi:outer membrane protein